MRKPNYIALAPGKILRLITALIPLVSVGRAFSTSGQTVTNLYSFIGTSSDGGNPWGPLVQGIDGNFYGTAVGGHYPYSTNNYGCVFRISPTGSFTNIHSFKGSDGAYPFGGLIQGYDGYFYGVAGAGGTSNFGTVFRISPSGSCTNLYSFVGFPTDGREPGTGLVQGNDGNFYGTTFYGGTSTNCTFGCGTIFRISPAGNETNLHSFVGSPTDGAGPQAVLVQGSDGNFYGTASDGGKNGGGTLFRISPSGSYTNLCSFGGFGAPNLPIAGLVQGSDGNFYGTTAAGGTGNSGYGYGTVFRISSAGTYTSLYFFTGPPADGVFRLPRWFKAVTAIFTGQPSQAGRA